MPALKMFYFSHAPENVYAIIREEIPPGMELVTLNEDSDSERLEKIAGCDVVIVAPNRCRGNLSKPLPDSNWFITRVWVTRIRWPRMP